MPRAAMAFEHRDAELGVRARCARRAPHPIRCKVIVEHAEQPRRARNRCARRRRAPRSRRTRRRSAAAGPRPPSASKCRSSAGRSQPATACAESMDTRSSMFLKARLAPRRAWRRSRPRHAPRDEARLVGRRREIDAALEHRVEEAVEALPVALHDLGEARRRRARGSTRRTCCRSTAPRRPRRPSRLRLQALHERARGRLDLLLEARFARTSFRVARPAATATGLPDSVPAWYTGPSGAIFSMMSRRPPNAPTGRPPPITLPSVVRSGRMPKRACAPPSATRKPVITSSKISTAPWRVHSSRSASRKPGAGSTRFMLPATGSTITPAICLPFSAKSALQLRRCRCSRAPACARRSRPARRRSSDCRR